MIPNFLLFIFLCGLKAFSANETKKLLRSFPFVLLLCFFDKCYQTFLRIRKICTKISFFHDRGQKIENPYDVSLHFRILKDIISSMLPYVGNPESVRLKILGLFGYNFLKLFSI